MLREGKAINSLTVDWAADTSDVSLRHILIDFFVVVLLFIFCVRPVAAETLVDGRIVNDIVAVPPGIAEMLPSKHVCAANKSNADPTPCGSESRASVGCQCVPAIGIRPTASGQQSRAANFR